MSAIAEALGSMSLGKSMAAAANTEGRTCAGCVAYDRNCKYCEPLRRDGECQKQVYVRVTLARLIVDMVCAGIGVEIIREVVGGASVLMPTQQKEVTGGN